MQFMLQVFHRRNGASGPHTKAQRVEAFEDSHLPVLRQKLHPRDIFVQTFAEACRAC